MRILLLNQFVPPDVAPTARLLGEVGEELTRRGHEVLAIGNRADYRGKKTFLGSRALREVFALLQLLVRGSLQRRCDVMLSLTSPPLLPVLGLLLRFRHRRVRLVHWGMDLYPDVAVELGEIERGSPLHRATRWLMEKAYQACDLIITLDDDMASRIKAPQSERAVVAPWPPPPSWPSEVQISCSSKENETEVGEESDSLRDDQRSGSLGPHRSRDGEERFTWLYSGNLGRAHEWETLLKAQGILEGRGLMISLVFQGRGTEIAKAKKRAETLGLQHCLWRDYAEENRVVETLLSADCLVATQRRETRGCLWPSKLALASLLDQPIVWIGPEEGSVSTWLAGEGHGCFAVGETTQVADHIEALSQAARKAPISIDVLKVRVGDVRRKGIARLASLILG